MSIPAAVLDAMVAAGASAEVIAAAVKAAQATDELKAAEKRAKASARQRKSRERRAMSQPVTHSERDNCVTERDTSPPSSSPSFSPFIQPPITTPSSTPSPSGAVAGATRPAVDGRFDEFWREYPKRDGANPKEPARQKFRALVKSGVDPDEIISGASRYRAEMASKGQERTPYVAQATTWLNQQRWKDYPAAPDPPAKPVLVAPVGAPSDEDLRKRYGGQSHDIEPGGPRILRVGVERGAVEAPSGPGRIVALDQAGAARVPGMAGVFRPVLRLAPAGDADGY